MGQLDSNLVFQEVEVSAKKLRKQSIGKNAQGWENNSSASPSNIADFLTLQSNIFIKSYGQGGLGTSSIRGGSGGHTLVLWNDVPIQSPMLGLLDLSLLPVGGFEEINLERGGNSSLWGSGAIGGIISLDNEVNFSNKIRVSSNSVFGSFGYFSQGLNFSLGNKKFQSKTRLSYERAENDFPYSINGQEWNQSNADFFKQNLLQDFYWKVNSKNHFSTNIWLQRSDVSIPPLLTQTSSLAHQEDQASRFILNWKRIDTSQIIKAKVAFFNEDQYYFDDAIGLEANNAFTNVLSELEYGKNINNKDLLFGITQNFTQANSTGYNTTHQENKIAIFSSFKFEKEKLKFQTSLRQEFWNGKRVPLVPSVGVDYQLHDQVNLKFHVSKNYRLPTLNDRFWFPGGNEDLLPESGWSEELGLDWKSNGKENFWKYNVTIFNRNTENWILWTPLAGNGFWSPNNIAKVWSRGIENQFSFSKKIKDLEMSCYVGYDYILSTNQIALDIPKIDKGEQLAFTPKHRLNGQIQFGFSNFNLSYWHQYVSSTRGANEKIDGYHVGNATLSYQLKWNKFSSNVFFKVQNIWDAEYFVIERRLMPGRNYQLGININFYQ